MIDEFEDYLSTGTTQQQLSSEIIRSKLLEAFKTLSKKAPSSSQLQKSHSIISDMMKNELFLQTSVLLLQEFQHSTDYTNLSKLIVTTLSTFLKHQQSGSKLVRKLDRHTLNSKLIDVFLNISIEEEYRQLLIKSYTQFVFVRGMETVRNQTVELICNTFGLLTLHLKNEIKVNQVLSQEQTSNMMSYLMVARAYAKGPIQNLLLKSIVRTFLPSVQLLSLHFLSRLSSSIQEKNEPLFMQLSGICNKLIEFFKELIVGTSKDYLSVVKVAIMKDQLVKEVIYQSLYLTINTPNFNNRSIQELIVDAKGNKYVERINEIKQNCVTIVNHFAKLCITAQCSTDELQKDQYKMSLEICQYFLTNIPEVLIRQFEDLPHPGLYKIAISALASIVRLVIFFDISFKVRSKLFYKLCIPLMQRKEADQYRNGEEFKGRREDIFNTHSLDIPENSVCKLIEAYIDRIDGSVMIFSYDLFQLIEFHLTANPNAFSKLPIELTQSHFFKTTDYMIQIQCCLSLFTLFSYMTAGRQELVLLMQQLFTTRRGFLFNPNNNGMFKLAVLLTYTYYVDNFYVNLKELKSSHKEFHLSVLQFCCNNILAYTQNCKIEQERKGDYLSLEIGALQSLDCLNNCITQKLFLQALFWTGNGFNSKITEACFLNLFNFLIRQLTGKLNISVIDALIQFFTQSIKNHCEYGYAVKRFHYEYQEIPMAVRLDICNFICEEIYNVYNSVHIPNHSLMKSKIVNLLRIVLTCCEFPDQFMNHQFFALKIEENDVWEVAEPIDIFLRRMIIFKKHNRSINDQILVKLMLSAANLLQISLKDYKMHQLFGIIVNLFVLKPEFIDDFAIHTSNALAKLLKVEDESHNYDEDLEGMVEKLAYINLIGVNDRFSPRTQEVWCFLTERIQEFLEHRSTKGIIAVKSIPYVGKLLTISLVCLYNMQKILNFGSTEKSIILWNNILRTADVYATAAERQIVSKILFLLLDSKERIEEQDEQCKRCFTLASHVMYKDCSKANGVIQENYDDSDNDGASSSGCDDSSEEEAEQSEHLNYREYKIAVNEYSKREKKEKYILLFKNICHKLKGTSPQFLKSVVEALPLPIKTFVKTQVFFFQSGSDTQPMRKLIKVKKEIPIKE